MKVTDFDQRCRPATLSVPPPATPRPDAPRIEAKPAPPAAEPAPIEEPGYGHGV